MKKLLFILFLFSCHLSFGQGKWNRYWEKARVDSIRIGDSILTQATFLRIGTGGGSGSVNSGGATNITGLIKGNGSTLSAAVAGTDYATAAGIHYEQAVKYATTAALPASTYNNGTSGVGATLTENSNGALSVDGASPTTGDRILVKNEVATANNGIYTVTNAGGVGATFVLTRATDWDQSTEVQEGDALFVLSGTANGATSWYQQTAGTITIGTTAIVLVQFNNVAGLADPGGNGVLVRTATNTTTNRTITGTSNRVVITNGDGVSGNPTLDVGTNIVDKTVANSYTAGAKQSFVPSSTTAGINIGTITPNPSGLADGDLWVNTASNTLLIRLNGTIREFDLTDLAQTLSSKTINLSNNTVSGTTAQFNTALSDNDFATQAGTETLTNKRINPRVLSAASSASYTPNSDSYDMEELTALAAACTFNNPTGTPVDGQTFVLRLKDNGTARALTWSGTQYRASSDLALPATTVISKTMYLKFIWNSADTKWDFIGFINNF